MFCRYTLVRLAVAVLFLLGTEAHLTPPTEACFGTRLRIGVGTERNAALAGFVCGYWVEEKTGIEPEFEELSTSPVQAFLEHSVDLYVAPEGLVPPTVVEVRPGGVVPGLGSVHFWIHREVLDDLRFSTVERALSVMGPLFSSAAYREATGSAVPARKAARQAVFRAQ